MIGPCRALFETNSQISGLTQYGRFARNASMNADMANAQRIGRLTPLADVWAWIDATAPVALRRVSLSGAEGLVLAADVVAPAACPSAAVALRDGWAVAAEATRDAGPYAPMLLQPNPERVDAFAPMPPGTDAMAPLDAVVPLAGMMQVIAPVAPGEGVLLPGGNAADGAILRGAGQPLRPIDLVALGAAGVTEVEVRTPRIRIAVARPDDAILQSLAHYVARMVQTCGAIALTVEDLDDALRDEAADAVIGVGGTGSGRHDRSVIALERAGTLRCHGIGLMPGDTGAFGEAGNRPVLLMPGRIDAVLACWLTLGQRLVARLTASKQAEPAIAMPLARKVTSNIGIAQVVPVRYDGEAIEPLGAEYLSPQVLGRANGWIFIAAESEGYPAGTSIHVRPLP
jgi:molybdopterin molybdotransferase